MARGHHCTGAQSVPGGSLKRVGFNSGLKFKLKLLVNLKKVRGRRLASSTGDHRRPGPDPSGSLSVRSGQVGVSTERPGAPAGATLAV
jgi:hypothetical protein